jgi:hypothetical protein
LEFKVGRIWSSVTSLTSQEKTFLMLSLSGMSITAAAAAAPAPAESPDVLGVDYFKVNPITTYAIR